VNKSGKWGTRGYEKPNKIKGLLAEKSVRDAGVAGSNPATPTIFCCLFKSL